MPAITNSPTLEIFVDKLIEEKGLRLIDPETIKQVRADLYERLEEHINANLLAKLPEEKLADFEKLLDAKAGPAETQKFLRDNIVDVEAAVAFALLNFRKTYLQI